MPQVPGMNGVVRWQPLTEQIKARYVGGQRLVRARPYNKKQVLGCPCRRRQLAVSLVLQISLHKLSIVQAQALLDGREVLRFFASDQGTLICKAFDAAARPGLGRQPSFSPSLPGRTGQARL